MMKSSLFLIAAVAVELASGDNYDRYVGLAADQQEDALYQPAHRLRTYRGLMSMHGESAASTAGAKGAKASSAKSESAKAEKAPKAEKSESAKAEKT